MPAQLGINGFDRIGMLLCHFCETRCDNGHCPRPPSGFSITWSNTQLRHSKRFNAPSRVWFLDVRRLSPHHLLQYFITSPRLLETYLFLVVNKAFVLRPQVLSSIRLHITPDNSRNRWRGDQHRSLETHLLWKIVICPGFVVYNGDLFAAPIFQGGKFCSRR